MARRKVRGFTQGRTTDGLEAEAEAMRARLLSRRDDARIEDLSVEEIPRVPPSARLGKDLTASVLHIGERGVERVFHYTARKVGGKWQYVIRYELRPGEIVKEAFEKAALKTKMRDHTFRVNSRRGRAGTRRGAGAHAGQTGRNVQGGRP